MRAAMLVGGFDAEQANRLRRALDKGQAEETSQLGVEFMTGAERGGYARDAADLAWQAIGACAGNVVFGRSHAVSLALMAYRHAYLAVHYPVEVAAAAEELAFTPRPWFPGIPRTEEETAAGVGGRSADLAVLVPPPRAMEVVLVVGPRGTGKTSYACAVASEAAAAGCEVACRTFSPFADEMDLSLAATPGIRVGLVGERVSELSVDEAFTGAGSRRLLVFDRIDLDESVLGSTRGTDWNDLGRALSLQSYLGYCPVIAVLDTDTPDTHTRRFDPIPYLEGYCDAIIRFTGVGAEGEAAITVIKSRHGSSGETTVRLQGF